MGQEQSSNANLQSDGPDAGVHVVRGSGSALVAEHVADDVERLLNSVRTLPVPQPVLPPPSVKDDMQSALQGAAMMHELRSLLGGILPNRDASAPDATTKKNSTTATEVAMASSATANSNKTSGGQSAAGVGAVEAVGAVGAPPPPSNADASAEAVRGEQEAWARVAVDSHALQAVLCEVTGGSRMGRLVDRQMGLMKRLKDMATLAGKLGDAVDAHVEIRKTSIRTAEKVDRLKMAFADVQDVLEQVVATANILGASHFVHDDEMCSFKNYLKHHPPRDR